MDELLRQFVEHLLKENPLIVFILEMAFLLALAVRLVRWMKPSEHGGTYIRIEIGQAERPPAKKPSTAKRSTTRQPTTKPPTGKGQRP